ncbi:MAG TPA: AIPR family protein [Alcanivoracaceae bacterium]|nr:AIPR family protein [Alcanivoracaceae bacterium]
MLSVEDFFKEFQLTIAAGAEESKTFTRSYFVEEVAKELQENEFSEGFELAYYQSRGIRLDGYWFDEEGSLDLYLADFESLDHLATLTKTEIDKAFTRLINFFEASATKGLADNLELTSPSYDLASQIEQRLNSIYKIRLILISERAVSGRVKDSDLKDLSILGKPASKHVWDITRLHRVRSSKSQKEALDFDFIDIFGKGIPGLPAYVGTEQYESYLLVMPGDYLADLYEEYGARLLEQNVRTFLQARGNVNRGIRATILNEPEMFFAYNNGITATAKEVEAQKTDDGLIITRIKDLQIVNGGQTTASLFHTRRRDKADLSKVFVQMKLSVIEPELAEEIVPRISEYANTQNRVNAADFFSNHPFHIRMEEFSRRLWAPAKQGAQRETQWFYERARGQYADRQSTMTPSEKKRFRSLSPTNQKFTKTDLAKFENVWDDHPMWVNRGAQRNFAEYAKRIGKEWEADSEKFSELYFKNAIARAIIFKSTEQIVSAAEWYSGGYRANIVAYTIAMLSEIVRLRKSDVNLLKIWNAQEIPIELEHALESIAKYVHNDIMSPPTGISNISEWCKKKECWDRLKAQAKKISDLLSSGFERILESEENIKTNVKQARQTQRIDDGIKAQAKVVEIPGPRWKKLSQLLASKGLLSAKEADILKIASQLPNKLPTEAQSIVLLSILQRAYEEGISG